MSYDPRKKVCPPLQPLDPYAAEKGLAKRVAHGLRGILAKLPDEPTTLDELREHMQRPYVERVAELLESRATPCHDWPSREDLPTSDPERDE